MFPQTSTDKHNHLKHSSNFITKERTKAGKKNEIQWINNNWILINTRSKIWEKNLDYNSSNPLVYTEIRSWLTSILLREFPHYFDRLLGRFRWNNKKQFPLHQSINREIEDLQSVSRNWTIVTLSSYNMAVTGTSEGGTGEWNGDIEGWSL